MTQQILLLELNEINFDYVMFYAKQGRLPNLTALLEKHGLCETVSESDYDALEPWIQWVTAHTGLSLAEHGVFRLGDIINAAPEQIWENLETSGLKVGAISPMNAHCNLRDAAFFVPDPWTDTGIRASWLDREFFGAVREAVSDNARGRLSLVSMLKLLVGTISNAAPNNYRRYWRMLRASGSRSWVRAMFLDQLLADMFIRLTKERKPNFASLFLNAGAHIQHHYMFNSAAYCGSNKNPSWYLSAQEDPVLQAYELYDRILGQVRRTFPQARLMIATALHQDPCERPVFYWRLNRHADFLSALSIPFKSVEPRMSRDFLVSCHDAAEATEAERKLKLVQANDGNDLFDVDNRGTSLFVSLVYAQDIAEHLSVRMEDVEVPSLRQHVSFVALKNGRHNGVGYFCDTGLRSAQGAFPLRDVFHKIREAFRLEPPEQLQHLGSSATRIR